MSGTEPLSVHRMKLLHQRIEGQRPVDLQLLIEQGLSPGKIVDRHERIVLLQVTDPLRRRVAVPANRGR